MIKSIELFYIFKWHKKKVANNRGGLAYIKTQIKENTFTADKNKSGFQNWKFEKI